ncbi:MAG: site-2 protease family protein [Leptolyngbyaceae cyanobacterium RM1_1_2]|nr:site-2 protease family protein [Leptolyngbyaceae cyanobacterium RM1_1_2]
MITFLILLGAIAILAWGFIRVRPYGKLGILAWLQSVVLITPWLIFFGLFAAGIYINLAGVLALVLVSAGFYIYLGRQLRSLGADELAAKRASSFTAEENQTLESPSSSHSGRSDSGAGRSELSEAQEPAFTSIPAEDLAQVEGIFGIDTFFRTETIPYQEGAIFKGNLRGEPEATAARLGEVLAERLGDRYRLFLLEGPEDRPVVIVLPSSADPPKATTPQKVLCVVLAIATLVTCLETSGILLGFDFSQELNRWPEVLPLALGILATLVVHEFGHFFQAQRYGIQTSPPFFLPAWQIGSFGALTRFESLLPNRTALFDIAFTGPAAGGLLSLGMLLLGLVLSHPGSLFQIPAGFFQGSILVGSLARIILGSAVQKALVDINPLVLIGWLGLVINAINLMPAGQLDGGRVVQAVYGRKIAGRTTIITLIVLALVSFVNPLALYWAVLILFLQRNLERPCLNDLSEPDDARAALGLLALFLMLATLLPLSPSLAGRLGIGAAL